AERFAPLHHRFLERDLLESVQGIVMNEDRDRPLRRKQVRRMLDDMLEFFQSLVRSHERAPGLCFSCCGDHFGGVSCSAGKLYRSASSPNGCESSPRINW